MAYDDHYVPICNNSKCFAYETIWSLHELLPPRDDLLHRCPACEYPVVHCSQQRGSNLLNRALKRSEDRFFEEIEDGLSLQPKELPFPKS